MQTGQIDAFIDSSATLLGLPIKTEWRPGVRENFAAILQHMALLAAFPLPDAAEPASVYRLPDQGPPSG